MSMRERFLQTGLRDRGRVLTRKVRDGVRCVALDEGVVCTSPQMVEEAYELMGFDNYDKMALLAFLIDRKHSKHGLVGVVDRLICDMLIDFC